MQLDFAAVLVIAALVTGSIWLLDIFVLAPRRAKTPDSAKIGGRYVRGTEGAAGRGKTVAGAGAGAGGREEKERVRERKLPWYVDFSRSFFPVIIAVLVLRSFIVEPFRIPSGSMMPTLLPGDFILVNKFAYGLRLPVLDSKIVGIGEPQRGDVVVFRYPEDPSVAFIKRVVGLPGDRLEYRDHQLFINGVAERQADPAPNTSGDVPGYDLREEQLGNVTHDILIRKDDNGMAWEYVVPQASYFVMGDNRDNSRDSRFWGPLPERNLIGKAFLIWMNLDCITGNGHCKRIGRSIE